MAPGQLKSYCPTCHIQLAPGAVRCSSPSCFNELAKHEFYASGAEAMEVQRIIVNYHNKMGAIRVIASYSTSVVFAAIAASLIVFAPESRTTAANIVAAALVVLAAGIAGFTRFAARLPGLNLRADVPKS